MPVVSPLRRLAAVAAAAAGLSTSVACAHLDPFGADLGKVQTETRVVRAPYMATLRYFGYLAGEAPGATAYLWLPASTAELGVRALSPSKAYASPRRQDVTAPDYKDHRADKQGFDVALTVERCATIVDPTVNSQPCTNWVTLGQSDPNAALAAGKDGHQNAELRLINHPDAPARNLTRGLYRVQVADAHHAGATGTYLLEVGAPAYLDGAHLAPTYAALAEAVRTHAGDLPQVPAIGPTPSALGDAPAPVPTELLPPVPPKVAP